MFTDVRLVPGCSSPPRGDSDQLETPGPALFWHRAMLGSNKGPGPLIGVNITPGARTAGAATHCINIAREAGGQIRLDNSMEKLKLNQLCRVLPLLAGK